MVMKFYRVKDAYIRFLRQYEPKVEENKDESRPYIGVVLEVNGVKYYAPFTSPKTKHEKMHNQADFRKIAGGKYGAINFSNMIPVPDNALIPVIFKDISDRKRRCLLEDQYRAVLKDQNGIKKTAEELHELMFRDEAELDPFEARIRSRCNDLQKLESVYTLWK